MQVLPRSVGCSAGERSLLTRLDVRDELAVLDERILLGQSNDETVHVGAYAMDHLHRLELEQHVTSGDGLAHLGVYAHDLPGHVRTYAASALNAAHAVARCLNTRRRQRYKFGVLLSPHPHARAVASRIRRAHERVERKRVTARRLGAHRCIQRAVSTTGERHNIDAPLAHHDAVRGGGSGMLVRVLGRAVYRHKTHASAANDGRVVRGE